MEVVVVPLVAGSCGNGKAPFSVSAPAPRTVDVFVFSLINKTIKDSVLMSNKRMKDSHIIIGFSDKSN